MTGHKKDIILIGMPGCGKTSLGKRLAKALERSFLDLDLAVEEKAGKRISRIFEEDGQEEFRRIETEAFRQAVAGGRVLATGGGIVTRPENREIAKGGIVVFLDRPVEQILKDVVTDTRPLLAEGKEKLYRLYEERYLLYCSWADIHIRDEGTLDMVLKDLLREVKDYENHGH